MSITNPIFAIDRGNKFIDQRMQFPRIGQHFSLQMLKNFLIRRIKLHPSWKSRQILNPSTLKQTKKKKGTIFCKKMQVPYWKNNNNNPCINITTLSSMICPHEGQITVLIRSVVELAALIWSAASSSPLDHVISLLFSYAHPKSNEIRFSSKKHKDWWWYNRDNKEQKSRSFLLWKIFLVISYTQNTFHFCLHFFIILSPSTVISYMYIKWNHINGAREGGMNILLKKKLGWSLGRQVRFCSCIDKNNIIDCQLN